MMSWKKSCRLIGGLFLISQLAYSAQDPIGWELLNPIPATTTQGESYSAVYVLTSHLPFTMPTPLLVTLDASSTDYRLVDSCSGKSLTPDQSCEVEVSFTPTQTGMSHYQVVMHYANNVVPLPQQVTASAGGGNLVLDGQVDVPLPANTLVGDTQPVVFSFLNTSTQAATQINLTTDYPPGFVLSLNTCGTTLAPGTSCQVSGLYTPTVLGTVVIGVTLSYAEGTAVPLSTNTTVGTVALSGQVLVPLPANMLVNTTQAVSFSFTNTSSLPATGVSVETAYPADFTQTSNTCGTTIPPGASCQVNGTYAPTTTGLASISVTLSYAEGSDVLLSTQTFVDANAAVSGDVDPELPANILVGASAPVTFIFTNRGTVAATDVQVILPNLPGWTVTSNDCGEVSSPTTLPPNTSCQVSGTYTPPAAGPATVNATLSYQEGNSVPLSTTTTAGTVAVSGIVDPKLPPIMPVGSTKPVTFIFTNSSAILPATDVQLFPNYPLGFNETNNTCESTLAPSSSCQVSGIYTPTATGPVTVGVKLSYAEGSNVPLNTSTTVKQQVAYVVNSLDNTISLCSINSGGTFDSCSLAGSGFSNPQFIVFNAAGTQAYVTNFNDSTVSLCAVNASDGTLSSCNSTGSGFNSPRGIALNAEGTRVYVTSVDQNMVSVCAVNRNGTLSSCGVAAIAFSHPEGIALNVAGTRAYVSSSGNDAVELCAVNANDGTLSSCGVAPIVFQNPQGIALNAEGTRAYVTNFNNSTVSRCTVDASNGTLSVCSPTGSGFSGPRGIALNAEETRAYVALGNNDKVWVCAMDGNGTFSNCHSAEGAGFHGPYGVTLLLR